jgi:acetyl-CoA carboxylase biotin carboxyl carrier protein
MMKDKQTLKTIIEIFESSEVAKMELELEGFKIKLEKAQPVMMVPQVYPQTTYSAVNESNSLKNQPTASEPVEHFKEIKAPLVGTFYHASSPTTDPFVKVGDSIKAGQVVGVIEAMKVMNEVTSSIDGVIVECCVPNNTSVSFNQVLIKVKPHD